MSSSVQGTLPSTITLPPNWQDLAVEAYRENLTVAAACRASGISRFTFYKYMKTDPDFAQRITDAKEDAIDHLESSAYTRASDGVVGQTRTFYDQKGNVTSVQESITYSDRLAEVFLQAYRPDVFRTKSSLELTGAGGGAIQIQNAGEEKSKRLTAAVQFFLNAGMGDLRQALEYLTIRGVSKQDLALIKGDELIIPAGSSNGHHSVDAVVTVTQGDSSNGGGS